MSVLARALSRGGRLALRRAACASQSQQLPQFAPAAATAPVVWHSMRWFAEAATAPPFSTGQQPSQEGTTKKDVLRQEPQGGVLIDFDKA